MRFWTNPSPDHLHLKHRQQDNGTFLSRLLTFSKAKQTLLIILLIGITTYYVKIAKKDNEYIEKEDIMKNSKADWIAKTKSTGQTTLSSTGSSSSITGGDWKAEYVEYSESYHKQVNQTGLYCLPHAQFSEIDTIIQQAKQTIETRWDVEHFPYFKKLIHIPSKTWNLLKYRMIKAIILGHGKPSDFIMGFSGLLVVCCVSLVSNLHF